jgi:hypothetical protein
MSLTNLFKETAELPGFKLIYVNTFVLSCTTARQCTLSKCLKPDETKDDEEKIIPEYSDVNPLDIRSRKTLEIYFV